MYRWLKYQIVVLLMLYCEMASAEESSSFLNDPVGYITSGVKKALVDWIVDLLEGVRTWIVDMFQDMLNEVLDLIIKLLPKEISSTKITIPESLLDVLSFVGAIFPVSYAATLMTAYGTFKLSFWIYRKCLGFFGLVKPKFQ